MGSATRGQGRPTPRRWIVLAAAVAHTACGSDAHRPPVHLSFQFEPSSGTPAAPNPFAPGQPMPVRFYAHRFHAHALPDMLAAGGGYHHPVTLFVKDPDGLVYRWRQTLGTDEYRGEIERWRGAERSFHFVEDLRAWVPAGFPWIDGRYEVRGQVSVAGRPVPFHGPRFTITGGAAASGTPQLRAVLEANGNQFRSGDAIVLRGFIENVGTRPYLFQTALPFREARLVADPGWDRFPDQSQTGPIRRAHFTRLEPGQRHRLFEERFEAGRQDPHWASGVRRGDFPVPFASPDRTVRLRIESEGLFPEETEAETGVWSGVVESDPVSIGLAGGP